MQVLLGLDGRNQLKECERMTDEKKWVLGDCVAISSHRYLNPMTVTGFVDDYVVCGWFDDCWGYHEEIFFADALIRADPKSG